MQSQPAKPIPVSDAGTLPEPRAKLRFSAARCSANVVAINQHAIDRWLERTKCTKPMRAIRKLFDVGERAVPIGNNRYYAKGWIVVVVKGTIRTAYRPRTKEQMTAIYDAVSSQNEKGQR